VGRTKRGKPEETVDKPVGQEAETTDSLTGDKTLKAEELALARTS
jgi:hypothetical protein